MTGEKPTNLRLAVRNSGFGFCSLSCRLVGSSLAFIIIARLPSVSVSDFGQLTYATALTALFVMISQYGLVPLLVRDIAADFSHLQSYVRSAFALHLLLSLAGLIVLYSYVSCIEMTSQGRMICALIAIAFYLGSFSTDFHAIFQSQEQMHIELIGIAFENVLLVILTLCAFVWQPNIVGVACIFLVVKSAAYILNYVLCGWLILWIYPILDWKLWLKLLREATPFALAGMIALGIVQLDTILLREISPGDREYSVGLYQAAIRLFLVPMLLPQIVLKVFLPQLSRMHVNPGKGLVYDLGRINHILLTLGLLIGLVTLFRGTDLIRMFYGEKLADAGPLLQVLGITIMMRFGAAYNLYFTIHNRVWFRVLSGLLGLVAVVVFDWILIPLYGPQGAAYASVLAHGVYWVPFLVVIYTSERTIILGWRLIPALGAAMVLTMLLYITSTINLLYMLPVYMLVIAFLVFWTMQRGDRKKIFGQLSLMGA
ncbi:MAG: oligosaccharide flippase family protein [Pirellulales bacterium]|nr:oligosaccharide flippase family protein [Pirellulales bacterium]